MTQAEGHVIVRKFYCDMFKKAPDDIRWVIDQNEFDELMAAPGPDGTPCSLYRCAGGLGSQFLVNAYKHVLEGGTIPAL